MSILSKKYKKGCVQEAIDNMLPQNLSNYFFFDGVRWNDLKCKTSDIKDSINTILGVSGLINMKNHLKDKQPSVAKKLRAKLQGTSGEYERLQNEIKALEDNIEEYEKSINEIQTAIETTERTVESTQKTLNDNRKVEEDQKELKRLEMDIETYQQFRDKAYADIVKMLSTSTKYFAATLLPEFEKMLEKVDLEGKDIPGVTVNT